MDGSLGSDGDVSGDDHGGGRHGHRREGYIGVGGRRGWIQIKAHDNMLPLENTLKITKVIFIILNIYLYHSSNKHFTYEHSPSMLQKPPKRPKSPAEERWLSWRGVTKVFRVVRTEIRPLSISFSLSVH